MWRKTMKEISEALKAHLKFRHDAQLADFLQTTRQHIYVAIKEDRFLSDKVIKKCIENDIDLTRLIRDAKAVSTSQIDYSEAEIQVSEFEEGDVFPIRKRGLQKWIAEFFFQRTIDLNETLSSVKVLSNELSDTIKKGNYAFVDSSLTKPQAGNYYINLNGYGMFRKIMKAPEKDQWFLLADGEEPADRNKFSIQNDFEIIGKVVGFAEKI